MKNFTFMLIAIAFAAGLAAAQPRAAADNPAPAATAVPRAPEIFEAKYEGGLFGYSDNETGRLKFDDANSRLVFYGKNKREKFSIPYDSILAAYPQSNRTQSKPGGVISHIPLPGAGLAGLIRAKRRYLVLQVHDQDVDVRGVVNLKLNGKELLESVLHTLGAKAGLVQKGDAFYRGRNSSVDY